MNSDSLLPPVEKKRLSGFPFFGLFPAFEYRYKCADTQASRDYLSHNSFPDLEALVSKESQIEDIIKNELGSLLASKQLSYGLADYLKEMGVLMWGISPQVKNKWLDYLRRLQSEIVIQLTVAREVRTESSDYISIKCVFRISRTHDDLLIPTMGIGSACYLNEIIALESRATLFAMSREKCPYRKLAVSLAFVRDHHAVCFFPNKLIQRLIFQQIRKRAVNVKSFTKPLL